MYESASPGDDDNFDDVQYAIDLVEEADALIFVAGAGIHAGSEFEDFGVISGFSEMNRMAKQSASVFEDLLSPVSFAAFPKRAWGYYGQLLDACRQDNPHSGVKSLLELAAHKTRGARVFTNRVDGRFQLAGFADSHVIEALGSIHQFQCAGPCCDVVWPADQFEPDVDVVTGELRNAWPICMYCGGMVRPNVLMNADSNWVDTQVDKRTQFEQWIDWAARPVVVEIGIDAALSEVRRFTHDLWQNHNAKIVRINDGDCAVPDESGVGMAADPMTILATMNIYFRFLSDG